MNLYQEVIADTERRAAAGEPFDPYWSCGLCGLDGEAGVRAYPYVIELRPAKGKRPRLIDIGVRLVCPCCSFKTCPHRFPDCSICHHSTAPTGTYASGGPFVRCDGEASHPVEVR